MSEKSSAGPSPGASSIRDTLFGDQPVEAWPPEPSLYEPWATFVRAREALARNQVADAIAAWQRVTDMPDLESRHYAQAWHFLRAHGIRPPAERAKALLGVVLEVPMNAGLDVLTAYPERTARYYNYSGGGVVWEHPNDSLDESIDALLRAGERVLAAIGPWEGPRPGAPPAGQVRLNLLTPSGLHFGQGPFDALAGDPMAGPILVAGTALMRQLVALGIRTSPA